MTRLLACLLLLLLPASLWAQSLKLVVQAAGEGAFDAAAWTPDGRWLIEASGRERVVRIWDPGADITVDSIRLPLPGHRADEQLEMIGIRVSADGRRATVEAVVAMENEAVGDMRRAAIDYEVDLLTRRVRTVPTSRMADDVSGSVPGERDEADPDAGRPALPDSPDGTKLRRIAGGIELLSPVGEVVGTVTFGQLADSYWASVSPDGSMVVFLSHQPEEDDESGGETTAGTSRETANAEQEEPYDGPITELVIFNTTTGRSSQQAQPWENYGHYQRVGWLGDGRILLSEGSTPWERDKELNPDTKGAMASGWLMDLVGDAEMVEVDPGCYMQPLGPDRLVSAGLANCRHGVPRDHAIWVRSLEGEWVELPVELPSGGTVDGLQASPDGRLLAISFGRRDAVLEVRIVDSVTGATRHSLELEGPMVTAMNFHSDGRSLIVMGNRWAARWRFEDDVVEELPATDFDPSMMVSDGDDLLFGGETSPSVQRLRLGTMAMLPPLDVPSPVAGGFFPDKPILWVGTADGELKLFDRRDWSLIATLQRFRNDDGEHYIVHDPAGRYDSNLPPDYAPFRWLVSDAPFQSLGPQTFMRELYTPDLLARLLACVPERRCDALLPKAPDIATLNRALPEVRELTVRQGAAPDLMDVDVVVADGVSDLLSDAYSGRARSGVHNVRLFRNGVLVAEAGAVDPAMDPADRAAWRRATMIAPNRPDGTRLVNFRGIRLPTGGDTPEDRQVEFSVYAFNEDRVKGEDLGTTYEAPALPLRPRRLFLLTVGVDAYPGGLFRPLRYAVADAARMGEVFAKAFVQTEETRPLEVVRISVAGTADAPATKARIVAAAARLHEATPDDIVILSFSGHGYTDSGGKFALVPSDVQTDGDRPDVASMITADDLARWLMPLDAGAVHVVIDACHSSASVQSGGFKPGPMGDPGLGQMAYDKGIRLLSASAPDQYAMEDTALGHGMLTYALVVEGAEQGRADGDRDGVVTMDELMDYAVRRLPKMADPLDPLEGPGLVVEWSGPPMPRQTPSLFDFSAEWSPLALRVAARP